MVGQDRREGSGLLGFSFQVSEIERRLLSLFRTFAVSY